MKNMSVALCLPLKIVIKKKKLKMRFAKNDPLLNKKGRFSDHFTGHDR